MFLSQRACFPLPSGLPENLFFSFKLHIFTRDLHPTKTVVFQHFIAWQVTRMVFQNADPWVLVTCSVSLELVPGTQGLTWSWCKWSMELVWRGITPWFPIVPGGHYGGWHITLVVNMWTISSVSFCAVISCLTLCNPMDCSRPSSSAYGDSPGKHTEVGCHTLLQGIFRTQGSPATFWSSGEFPPSHFCFTRSCSGLQPHPSNFKHCLNIHSPNVFPSLLYSSQ